MLTQNVYAANTAPLHEKYPNYAYVFSEFDVDSSFIYDEGFEKFVLKNEKNIQAFYERSLKEGDYLLYMMKNHMLDKGVSDLFVYISMIESGFSTDIVSAKKAVGLWQFMPATAKAYNLEVCYAFDERCDPESSTKAALNYLKKLHKEFGKWYLAVMAYNCGEGRLRKAIKKAGSDDLNVLINSYEKYLPKETRKYIQKILLAALIGESEVVDFESDDSTFMQVDVKACTKLKALAKLLEMKESLLLKLNVQYKKGVIPSSKRQYKIVIPEEKMVMFYMKYQLDDDNATATDNNAGSMKPHLISHVVVLGDTLESIALKYDTSVKEIKFANKLQEDALVLDALLLIPVSEVIFEALLTE